MRPLPRVALAVCVAHLALGCEPEVELLRATSASAPDAQTPRWTLQTSGVASDLRAVWGTSSTAVWAVGDGGVALFWEGASWRSVPTNTGANLTAVWASRSDDAWAIGANADGSTVLLRWDGTRWSPSPSPQRNARTALKAVWGTSAQDVWLSSVAEMPDPAAWHWDGTQWRPEFIPGGMRPPGLVAIAGTGADDVWFAAEQPILAHHNASGWDLPVMLPRGTSFDGGLCATVDRSVWITSGANLLRYTAGAWSSFPIAALGVARALWCVRGDDVWAVGEGAQVAHWDGARWSLADVPRANLADVWRAPSGEVWAVGARGTILRYGL